VNSENPKFEKGDLVVWKGDHVANMEVGVCIVVSDPRLMLETESKHGNGLPTKFWCYDLNASGKLLRSIPEEFIRSLKDETETKDH
jgi:hypothetical protein